MISLGAQLGETIEYAGVLMPSLLKGAFESLKLFICTLLFSIPLGLPITLGRISRIPPLRWLCKLYILLFRGTPLMLQLFFFYYALAIAMDIKLSIFAAATLTFTLNYAAYFAEIYRGGIESIDKGQHEAAYSLGLSKSQTMIGIILPQTVKRVLPAISNEAIVLVKDTALASVIGMYELMKVSYGILNRDTSAIALLIAAVIYLSFTAILTVLSGYLERRYSRHENRED
ncbi:MAG: amino acid ABC transporter permease [Anaerovoracaceae bacterium]|jgi:polar amino acid transport system permease protein